MRIRQSVPIGKLELTYNSQAINDSRPILIRKMYDDLKKLPTYTTPMPDGSVNLQTDIVVIDINIMNDILYSDDIDYIKRILIGELQ